MEVCLPGRGIFVVVVVVVVVVGAKIGLLKEVPAGRAASLLASLPHTLVHTLPLPPLCWPCGAGRTSRTPNRVSLLYAIGCCMLSPCLLV